MKDFSPTGMYETEFFYGLLMGLQETQVTKKREQIELRNFVARLDNMAIEIKKLASPTNPTFLRETLRGKNNENKTKVLTFQ